MKRKILIVDDSEINKLLLNKMLCEDYDTLLAENGSVALDILRLYKEDISAVLLDLLMPVMDGYEVITIMRNDSDLCNIPVIVTTSNTETGAEVKALSLGANDFIAKPYNTAIIKHRLRNTIKFRETAAYINSIQRDRLTGLYNRETFFSKAEELIASHEPGYYVMACFDVNNFKVINDQHGNAKGDELLKHISTTLKDGFENLNGICCRIMADNFAVLFPHSFMDSELVNQISEQAANFDGSIQPVTFSIGCYIIDDLSLSCSAMYDRAAIASNAIKARFDTRIALYNESMRMKILREQRIVDEMDNALATNQFEIWLQPQYNHSSGAIIGAEALVRWRHPTKGLIPPFEFIPVFEQNGFIYEMDKYIWREACKLLRKWLDEGFTVLPISVNVSRYDIFRDGFFEYITGLIEEYDLPRSLLRIEITESAFSKSTDRIISAVKRLIDFGFIIEIDDFGSGYSSLNTLKDVPADILKLDMRFLAHGDNSTRGGNIVESVVRMAKWLGMPVIAEGVETKEQADYLRSIGCFYIQGYLYARPMPVADYEKLLSETILESKLNTLTTIAALDNNAFWDPNSMETLIFNSYVGGACIFEYQNGRIEILRVNEKYAKELGGNISIEEALTVDVSRYMDLRNTVILHKCIRSAIQTNEESTCEICLTDIDNKPDRLYIRITTRMIARTDDRMLFYCALSNVTAQREAEQRERNASQQLSAIMSNINGGVTAVVIEDKPRYLFANDHYYSQLGYTKEQFTNEVYDVFEQLVHPEDRAQVKAQTEQASRLNVPFTITYRVICRGGNIKWICSSISTTTLPDVKLPVQIAVATDVTAQVEAEHKERKASEQLHAITNSVNGGVTAITMDDDGNINYVFANSKYYTMQGYTKEQFNAEISNPFDRVHPDDRQRVFDTIIKTFYDQTPITFKYRLIKRDGNIIDVRVNSTITNITGVEGNILLSVITDITEIVKVERRMVETSEQLRVIMNNVDAGISAVTIEENDDVRLIFSNDQYYTQLGYTREQFDTEVFNALNRVHPDDLDKTKKELSRLQKFGGAATYEYRCFKRDGSIIHLRCNTNVIGAIGINNRVLLSITTDITDLILAQQNATKASAQLEAIMQNVRGGVSATMLCNGKPKYIFVNEWYYSMFGYTKEQFMSETKNGLIDIVYPDDLQKVIDVATNTKTINESFQIEFRAYKRDGSIIWVRSVGSICNLAGYDSPIQLGVATDITKEVEATRQIIQSREQLKFLNETAHDLLTYEDTDASLNGVLYKVLEYFDGKRAYIIESDAERELASNTYEICAEGVSSQKSILQDIPFSRIPHWAKAHKENSLVNIEDISHLGDDRAEERALLQEQGIRSLIAVPLVCNQRSIGFIGIDDPNRHHLHVEQLMAIGDYVAAMLNRRDLNAKIQNDNKILVELMNDTPGGFVRMTVREDGAVIPVYANDGFCRITGMTFDEIMSNYKDSALWGVHPADVDIVNKVIRDMYETGEARSSKYRLRHGNGGYVWVMIFGRKTVSNDGKVFFNIYYTDASEDETPRTPLSNRLVDEESALSALPYIDSQICIYDPADMTLVISSQRAMQYGTNTLLRNIPHAFYESTRLRSDTIDALKEFFNEISNGSTTGETKYCICYADGSWHWEHARFHSLSRPGNARSKVIICIDDITASKHIESDNENERIWQIVAQHSSRAVLRYDIATGVAYADVDSIRNRAIASQYSNLPESVIEAGIVLPESVDDFRLLFNKMSSGETSDNAKVHLNDTKGIPHWIDMKYSLLRSHDGKPKTAVISLLDITENHEKELAYNRYLQTIDKSSESDGVLLYIEADITAGRTEKCGGAMQSVIFPHAETDREYVVNTMIKMYVVPEERDTCHKFFSREHLIMLFSDGVRSLSEDWSVILHDGSLGFIRSELQMVQDPYTRHIKAYTILRNITEEKLSAITVKKLAETDGMTGLYNKTTIENLIKQRLSRPVSGACVLLIADLDNLKIINDTYGHDFGDKAIQQAANTIYKQFHEFGIIGRIGGDEFAIFIDESVNEAMIRSLVFAFFRKLSTTHVDENKDIYLRCSIGIAIGTTGEPYEELFKRADKALYHTKRNGKNDFAFYTPDMEMMAYQYRGHNETFIWKSDGFFDTAELDNLLHAISTVYPLVISVNLTRNCYYMMQYDGFTTTSCIDTGVFDDLIADGVKTFREDAQASFLEAFSRENLFKSYQSGKKAVSHEGFQMGDDGKWHFIHTDVIFVQHENNSDLCQITLAREIKH